MVNSRRKSVELSFNRYSIYLALIFFALSDSASTSRRSSVAISDADNETPISNGINDLRQRIPKDTKTVVETVCRDFRYPVKTTLELINRQEKRETEPITRRFRRDDDDQWTDGKDQSSTQVDKGGEEKVAAFVHEMLSMLEEVDSNREPGFYTGWIEQDTRNQSMKTTARFRRNDKVEVTQNGSSKDYMSTYYAQRKAIMDKYKAQQREIMERLKKTKSLIAETKRLKESKKIDFGKNSASQNGTIASHSNVTHFGGANSTIAPNPTRSSIDFDQTTIAPSAVVPIFNSAIVNGTKKPSLNNSESFFNSSDYEAADYSSEVDLPNSTQSSANETLRPFVNDRIDIFDRPDVETLEGDWPSESVNLIPQNEVDSNLTEQSLTRQERDNDTVIFSLGGQLANLSIKKNSAFDQLEKMFLWEVPVGDERVQNENTISDNDRSENSSHSSDSLRFMVEIKSSPEVEVMKNIKHVQTSTTTYRNSTHEIVEVNGVVNSTKRIDGVRSDVPDLKSTNFSNPDTVENGGGARESEWCEECPHDYRWGNCDGTLFYQHNIFLRNRGPSAIDAIFGMNVQGPVSITCVEAMRYNKTRGIVTLHSGGQGYDFAKLRIRGFQGEGFSYIMKVWGIANEEFVDGTNHPY